MIAGTAIRIAGHIFFVSICKIIGFKRTLRGIGSIGLAGSIVAFSISIANPSLAYDPPVGIPAPKWGNFSPIEASPPSWPAGWPESEAAGYYYVDNTHPGATDTGNLYGYPDKPRKTIPEITFNAGSYIEVHGGPYRVDGGDKEFDLDFRCSEGKPCWMVGKGVDQPEIRSNMKISGSYVLIDSLKFLYSDVSGREGEITLSLGDHDNGQLAYACLRNSEFEGDGKNHGFASGIFIEGVDENNETNHIIIYNNTIHDLGDDDADVENDYHGILPASYTEYIWVLENTIFDNAGDSIQVGSNNYDGDKRPAFIYIGRNNFHGDMENAVDVKQATDVIISQNALHGYKLAPKSDGTVIVSHRQNEKDDPDMPERIWILFNRIYDAARGVRIQETKDAWVIGNVIYDITCQDCSSSVTSPWRDGAAIHIRSTTSSGGIFNNTIYGCDIGIESPSAPPGGWMIEGNIIANRANSSTYDVNMGTTDARNSTFDFNLLYYPGDSLKIIWGNTYNDVNSFKIDTGKCSECPPEQDPKFSNPSAKNFSLQSDSPARNRGNLNTVYDTFFNLYGIDIKKDIAGNLRPQGLQADIGAYEVVDSSGSSLSPPKNLHVSAN